MAPTLTRPERPGGLTLGLGLAQYGPPRPISPEVMSSPGLWAGCKETESLPSGHPLGLVLSLGPSCARELCAMEGHRGALNGTDRPSNDVRDNQDVRGPELPQRSWFTGQTPKVAASFRGNWALRGWHLGQEYTRKCHQPWESVLWAPGRAEGRTPGGSWGPWERKYFGWERLVLMFCCVSSPPLMPHPGFE